MELNIWTSSTVTSARYDEEKKIWEVKVLRGTEKEERIVKPRHVVFALGLGSGVPVMPAVDGMVSYPSPQRLTHSAQFDLIQDKFKGKIVHSAGHGTARDYIGKKALVVGACTSGTHIGLQIVKSNADYDDLFVPISQLTTSPMIFTIMAST